MCDSDGKRKIVWINTSHGSYALNGSAIDWVQKSEKAGTSIIGADGNPVKLGRDYIDANKLHELIQTGLRKCN